MSKDHGPVETATRALVKGMGTLSAWQAVTAEQAIRLAGLLDAEDMAVRADALSRELRQVLARLAPVGTVAGTDPVEGGDAVAQVQDQLAARRKRISGA
jgi:hypothetical protein